MQHLVSPAIEVRQASSDKGRGVFAARDIAADELIEVCPVVVVTHDEVRDSLLDHYVFWWSEDERAVALGPLTLMNHSGEPNSDFEPDRQQHVIRVWATRDIPGGEELLIDYGCELWFDPE